MYGSVFTSLFSFTFLRLYTFSFSPGGVYDVTSQIYFDTDGSGSTIGSAWILICTDDQTSSLLNAGDSETLCRQNISQICLDSQFYTNINSSTTTWRVKQTILDAVDVNLLALSCATQTTTLSINYHMYNTNGELSSGDFPRIELTQIFSFLFASLGVLFITHLIFSKLYFLHSKIAFYQERVCRPLHIALLLVILTCGLACFASYEYWSTLSITGVDSLFGVLSLFSIATSAMARVAIVILLLAVGKGWQILRENLGYLDVRQIIFLSIFLWSSISILGTLGGLFSLFLVSLLYLIIMRFTFASMSFSLVVLSSMANDSFNDEKEDEPGQTENKENLCSDENLPSGLYGDVFSSNNTNEQFVDQSEYLPMVDENTGSESLVYRQLVLFRTLRAVSSVFFLLTLFFEVFWDLLGDEYPWIGYCVDETVMFSFVFYLTFALGRVRNKRESPLYRLDAYRAICEKSWEQEETNSKSLLLVSRGTSDYNRIVIAES
jgi:hypothetical protein